MEIICIALLLTGITFSTIGAAKAFRSKFSDLDCIIWCFAGSTICIFAGTLARFL